MYDNAIRHVINGTYMNYYSVCLVKGEGILLQLYMDYL